MALGSGITRSGSRPPGSCCRAKQPAGVSRKSRNRGRRGEPGGTAGTIGRLGRIEGGFSCRDDTYRASGARCSVGTQRGAWQLWGASELLVLVTTVVNLGITYRVRRTLIDAEHEAEEAGHELNLLSQVLKVFELEPFTSPMLLALQAQLKPEGIPPSGAIAKLSRRVESLESAHNLFVRVFDPVIFYRLQFVLAIESWRRRFGSSLRVWIETIGELEALAALGGYTYEHHEDVFPEFVDGAPCFEAKGLAHPLIPRDRAVANDLQLNHDLQLMIVSGPNMAGKSTFLRGIGVNAVLAQSGAPVRALSLQLSPLAVTASICVLDSLEGGISRFYAEINRLKQIMDLTNGPASVLFLLDELLSGTNSHDRLIGTRSFVTKLVEQGAVGLVSTHDLALTAIPQEIGPRGHQLPLRRPSGRREVALRLQALSGHRPDQ